MTGEFNLVREEIKTLQTEFHGKIGRIDARIEGQKTLVTGLLFPLIIAISLPICIYLVKKTWNTMESKFGDAIKKKISQN